MARSLNQTYRRLTRSFHQYQDAPREPERVVELASARAAHEDSRADSRQATGRYRTAPENPDFVEPGLGTDSRSLIGKMSAAFFAVVAVAAVVFVTMWVVDRRQGDVSFADGTVETSFRMSDGGRCVWQVSGDLVNRTDRDVEFVEVFLRTNRGIAPLVGGRFTVPAGQTMTKQLDLLLPEGECPATIGDISSGRIRVNDSFSIAP